MGVFKIIKIIAGKNKGFVLKTKEGLTTRPTLNRIKENVFNIIKDYIPDSNFLDLFSGSGGIGLEAISRGAKKAVLIEKDKKAFDVIKDNINKTKSSKVVEAFNMDFEKYIKTTTEKFEIIYVDPPYELDVYEKALNSIGKYNLLKEGGIIVLESQKSKIIPLKNDYFFCYRDITYGNTKIWIYKKIRREYLWTL